MKTISLPSYRPTWVEINSSNFSSNIDAVAKFTGNRSRLIAVVKANAYGHLAVPLSKIAVSSGVAALGVSSIEEGIALRKNAVTGKIIILGSIYPLENLAAAARYKLIPTISSAQGLDSLAGLGARTGKRLAFHLKIDTGMGRVGMSPDAARHLIEKIALCRGAALEGIYTHFSSADLCAEYTKIQSDTFVSVIKYAKKCGLKFSAHAANSAAILRARKTHFDMVRPGLILYGIYPFEDARKKISILPVMSWKTRIVFIKRMAKGACISYGRTFTTKRRSLIATLPVGYADGYSRRLSNNAHVLVRGNRCPVVGKVTMDMITIDVTDIPGAALGDEVVLIGSQGSDEIRAEEMAGWAETISYEITCAVSSRVPRIITDAA